MVIQRFMLIFHEAANIVKHLVKVTRILNDAIVLFQSLTSPVNFCIAHALMMQSPYVIGQSLCTNTTIN